MDLNEINISKSELKEVIQAAIYKTDLFQLEVEYVGEIRFGPVYYSVKVHSKGIEIWSGQNNIYGEESLAETLLLKNLIN